jgi:glycosyltransferase involved in cell wall biosynthesis
MYPSVVDSTNGIFIHNEVRALIDAGINVRVVSPVPWAPLILRFREKWRQYAAIRRAGSFECVPVERISVVAAPAPFHVIHGLTTAWCLQARLTKIRRQFPFDLIHAHTLTPDGWACCLLAKRFKVPTVCTIRGSDLNEYPHQSRVTLYATRHVLRRTDALIATSRALSEEAARLVDPPVHPTVIYKGVDFSVFSQDGDQKTLRNRLGLPISKTLIVFVGRVERDKGIGELFEAFLKVHTQHPRVRLLIVGNGSYLGAVKNRAIEASIADSVFMPDRVSPSEVALYLQASDLFVLPSYGEGMPNALLEAMACGLPSIASAVGGIPEVVEDGVSGILVPIRDREALEVSIRRVLSSPDLAARLGSEAARSIRARFSWQKNAQQNIEIYRSLLASWKNRKPPIR